MGLERLDQMCRESMGGVSWAASELRDALDAVTALVNAQTWAGPPADRWAAEFASRVTAIKSLLDQLPGEASRLVEKARQQQHELDRQRNSAVPGG